MNPFDRTYTAGEVADLAGTTSKNIQNWTARGLITGHEGTEGKGHPLRFSWFSVMEIACAVALMDLGLNTPQVAFSAATHFAHIGKGQSGWVGAPAGDQAVRHPSLPFHHMRGLTFLYVAGDQSAVILHRIFNKEPFPFHEITSRLGTKTGFIALNVTEMFKTVIERAGEDYREMLDAAYKGYDPATTWRQPGQEG